MPLVRVVFGTIGAVALLGGLVAMVVGAPLPVILGALGMGLVLTLGVIFERVHYKPLAPRPPAGYVATAERFVDPTTGRMVQVHIKPDTGERAYVDIDVATQEDRR